MDFTKGCTCGAIKTVQGRWLRYSKAVFVAIGRLSRCCTQCITHAEIENLSADTITSSNSKGSLAAINLML